MMVEILNHGLGILKNKRTLWGMSLGITWDNKESLEKVLKRGSV